MSIQEFNHKMTRREVLRYLGLGTLTIAVGACAPKATPQPESPQEGEASQKATEPAATAIPQPPAEASTEAVEVDFVMNDSPGWADAVNEMMGMFMDEYPNVKASFEPVEFDQMKTVLTPRFAAGEPPALLLCDCFWPWVQQGLILDLNPLIDRDAVDLSLISDLAAGKLFADPARYGLPFDFTGSVIAYNKTMYDKYGVAYPKPDWTVTDLHDAALALTRDSNDRSPLDADFDARNTKVYGTQLANMFFWGALVKLFGGRWWSEDGQTCLIDEPKAVEAFKFFGDLACKEHSLYGPQPTQQAGAADPFVSQQVAMTIEGEWQLALWKDITDFDWDIAAWPKGREVWQYGGSDAIGISKDYAHTEEAWQLMKFWTFNRDAALITGAIMPPALNEAGLSDEIIESRLGGERGPSKENTVWAYTNMRQNSDCSLYYMPTNASEWQQVLGDALTSLLTLCDQPAEELVKETAEQITEILRKPTE